MNSDTGHLVDTTGFSGEQIKQLSEQGYEEVPEVLKHAATRKLNGKKEEHVSLTSGGKLSKHAAKLRKAKRKKSKSSRKRNRK